MKGVAETSGEPTRQLTVFANIQNPYNGFLYDTLARCGWSLRVIYKGAPQSEGRAWPFAPRSYEHIAGSVGSEWKESRPARHRDAHVIVTGGYAGKAEFIRRRIAHHSDIASATFWGEPFTSSTVMKARLRRAYFAPFRSIFAVGTRAEQGYRRVVPHALVHTLPYTTGLVSSNRVRAEEPVIGFVGALIHRKGLDIVLTALGKLTTSERPLLEVVGSGPEGAKLRARAASMKLRVRWLDEIPHQSVQTVRQGWWAQVVPSRYDGWGVVVNEALTAGIPVVASNSVGAAVDMIRPGLNGALVHSDDEWPSAIHEAIDPRRADALDAAARIVGREYAADRAAEWLQDLLDHDVHHNERSFVREAWARVEQAYGRLGEPPP